MTDTKKFKLYLLEKGITMGKLSELTGISLTSLSYKANNHRQFLAREIAVIQNQLGMTNQERDAIFFASDVELKST